MFKRLVVGLALIAAMAAACNTPAASSVPSTTVSSPSAPVLSSPSSGTESPSGGLESPSDEPSESPSPS